MPGGAAQVRALQLQEAQRGVPQVAHGSWTDKQLEPTGIPCPNPGIAPASPTLVTSELPDEASGPVQIRVVYGYVDGSMTDKVVNLVDDEEPGTITVNGRL